MWRHLGRKRVKWVGSPMFYTISTLNAAEQSSSAGYLIEDRLAFPDTQGPVKLVFGCEDDETGEIFRQMADGIMGMGNNNNAFQSQVTALKM